MDIPLTTVDVEKIVRNVLRSDTQYRPIDTPAIPSQDALAGAVRAEFGRRNLHRKQLSEVLGVSRPTAYGRFSGAYPFTAVQLEKVSAFLGMSVGDLYALAVHGATFTEDRGDAAPTLRPAPVLDMWEQPRRARRAAAIPHGGAPR